MGLISRLLITSCLFLNIQAWEGFKTIKLDYPKPADADAKFRIVKPHNFIRKKRETSPYLTIPDAILNNDALTTKIAIGSSTEKAHSINIDSTPIFGDLMGTALQLDLQTLNLRFDYTDSQTSSTQFEFDLNHSANVTNSEVQIVQLADFSSITSNYDKFVTDNSIQTLLEELSTSNTDFESIYIFNINLDTTVSTSEIHQIIILTEITSSQTFLIYKGNQASPFLKISEGQAGNDFCQSTLTSARNDGYFVSIISDQLVCETSDFGCSQSDLSLTNEDQYNNEIYYRSSSSASAKGSMGQYYISYTCQDIYISNAATTAACVYNPDQYTDEWSSISLDVCVNKVCTCPNGSINDQTCTDPDSYACELLLDKEMPCCESSTLPSKTAATFASVTISYKCEEFQHMNETVTGIKDIFDCIPNICVCDNGTPEVDCPTHGATLCSACDTGYASSDSTNPQCDICAEFYNDDENAGICVPNVCLCDNGTAETQFNCPTNGATLCSTCNTGYTSSDTTNPQCDICANFYNNDDIQGTCVANACVCPNGTAETQLNCPVNGATLCSACNTGYKSSDDSNPQ